MPHFDHAPFVLTLAIEATSATTGAEPKLLTLEQYQVDCDCGLTPDHAAACSQVAERLLFERRRSARAAALHAQALDWYETGLYAEAFASFASAADGGHRPSARIALQMWQFGPRLYGQSVATEPPRLQRWRTILDGRDDTTRPPCNAAP